MVGAWVAFSLPWDVQVRRVKLGLPQAEGKRRRATAAVRRLQLSREGAVVAELDVAPGREPFVEWSVEERGGLFTVEVLEVARGAKMRQIGFSELEVWGHPNGATASVDYIEPDRLAREQEAPEQAWPLARVMTLAGAGGGPLVEATALSGRSTRTWPLPTKRGQWSAFPREDRDYVRVLQGSWSRLVRPERLVALSGRNGDRVFLALYHVLVAQEETAGTGPRSARRRCRGRTELLCTDAYLARVSLPARGVPVLDATTKVASNICGVTSKVALRDIDGDRKDELHLQLEWQTRRRCGAPGSYISEMIFDESTLRRQYQAVLTERPADACARSWQAEREVRDINADGFPDFFVNRQISEPTCRGRGRPRVQRLFADESFLYDPELDEWRRAAEETQPTPDG
jgi:hypothetical protein